MELKVFSIVGIVLFLTVYFAFKKIEVEGNKHFEEKMYMHNRNAMLRITDKGYKLKDDIFQKDDFLKMNNTGPIPEEEVDIPYKPFVGDNNLFISGEDGELQTSDKELRPLVNSIWKTIETGVRVMTSTSTEIQQTKNGEKLFKNEFLRVYREVADKYMEHPERPLDRHKIAAIIMVAIVSTHPIENESKNQNELCFANYALAVDCGLDYLLDEINRVLRHNNKDELNSFYFPEATACDTSYYRILFRNLYFAEQQEKVNPLDIAEKLFLLECLTFEKEDIDQALFKERHLTTS